MHHLQSVCPLPGSVRFEGPPRHVLSVAMYDEAMSIRTSRASGVAAVTIDEAMCQTCGACVRVCAGAPLTMADGKVVVDQSRFFGCVGCGACMAVCPTGAIAVEGRDLSREDVLPLGRPDERASYDELLALLRHRRSVREYSSAEVDSADLERILEAASTAPMGVPPSDVGVLVLEGRERVQEYRSDAMDWLVSTRRWLKPTLLLWRPFMRKDDYALMRDFVLPVVDIYQDPERDWFFYDAPLALIFYGCGACDPADPYIAATYAMIAAESLGLGSCMLGFGAYPIRYSRRLRRKWGVSERVQMGIALIVGHPESRFRHGIRRRFARVDRRA